MSQFEHKKLKLSFIKEFEAVSQTETYKNFVQTQNVQIVILENKHRNEAIDFLCNHFLPYNTSRQLIGADRVLFKQHEAIPAIDHAIETGNTLIMQDKNGIFMSKNVF